MKKGYKKSGDINKVRHNLIDEMQKNARLKVLLFNLITVLNQEMFTIEASVDDKIEYLKDEIGITDEEIKELDLIKECLE